MKKIGKSFLWFILTIILLFSFLLAAPKLFEKQIVNRALVELNKAIAAPVIVDEISFSLLKRFPDATIQFKNVNVLSGKGFNASNFRHKANADTLAQIKDIYLSINLFALINKQIEVKKVEINTAQVNILIDKKGNNNYNILHPKNDSISLDSSQFEVKLKKVVFVKTYLNFNNLYKQSNFSISAPHVVATGLFHKDTYSVSTEGDFFVAKIQLGTSIHAPQKPSRLDLNMVFANDTLYVNDSKIKTQYAEFKVSGYTVFKDLNYTNIDIKGNNIAINQIVALLPFKEKVKNYATTGFLDFHGLIKGNVSNTVSPYMLANFGINNGSVKYKDSLELKQINLKGRFSNGKARNASTMELSFKTFRFNTTKSQFQGSFSLKNFLEPQFKIQSRFNLDLDEFSPLINNEFIHGLSGKVKGELKTEAFTNDRIGLDSILFFADHSKAQLLVEDFGLVLPKSGIELENVSGKIDYQPNHIAVDSLSGKFNGIASQIKNGRLENLNHIFISNPNKPLVVNGDFKMDTVVFTEVIKLFESDDSSKSIPYIIKGNAIITEYYHNKIHANSLKGSVYITPTNYQLNDLTFNAFDGKIKTSINYQEKGPSKSVLRTKTKTENINISAYLEDFNNFNQKNLTHENINGNLSSDFESELTIIDGKIDLNSVYLLGYAKVSNGKLINYEPIEELARFTNMSELSNISFSTIENEILILDHTIHIPQMDLHSTSFDISLFGKQDLLGDYEYHIRVYLSDILSGKTKQLQKQQSEFGAIEDDGLGKTSLFLVTSHIDGKTKTRFDRKQMRKHLKSEFEKEKEQLKNIFTNDSDWINPDTSAKQPDNSNKPVFEIEWDDE